jgi:hypothetical protein
MKKLLAATAAAMAFAGPALAATWEYRLTGSLVTGCADHTADGSLAWFCDGYLGHSFDGSIFIDESKLSGGTLKSQTLEWGIWGGQTSEGHYIAFGENIAAIDVQIPLSPWGWDDFSAPHRGPGSTFRLTTDTNRKPLHWSLAYMVDGPDVLLGPSWLDVYSSGGMYAHAWGDPGALTRHRVPPGLVAPIPAPPAGLLLATAAFGAAAFARRRRRQAA